MNNLRSLPLCVLASAFLCSIPSLAQHPAPTVRIVNPIDESQLVTLKGNTNPNANAKNDRGLVSPSLPMAEMYLVLSRSPEQQASFDSFVASQYDSSSPNYHQWLTPTQIGALYGPAQADIATVSDWLTSQGFAVKSVSPDRMSIQFSGTAGQAESAFHVQIDNLLVNGKTHIANMTNPQIPAALAPVVVGIKGLHNFLPHPLHKTGAIVRRDPQIGTWRKLVNAASTVTTNSGKSSVAQSISAIGPRPQFGINVPANPTEETSAYLEEDVTPYDFATIYNVLPLWNASINGTGQTIALAETSEICVGQSTDLDGSASPCKGANDVASYRSAFGLPAGQTPKQVAGNSYQVDVCTSSTNACSSGDLEESSLDAEVSGAVAPQAQIVLVASGYNNQTNPTNDPIYDSSQYIVDNVNVSGSAVYGASAMSVSYGVCELFSGTSSNVAYYDLWQTAAAEGLSVFVAAGDSGSPSCDEGGDVDGNPYSAQYGLSVNGVASTPYNTAVGGTDFTWCQPTINSSGDEEGCPSTSSTASPYWNSTNASNGESAANYIPEKPWNDTCQDPTWAKYLESIASNASSLFGESFGSAGSTPEQACNWVENEWYNIDELYAQEGYSPLGLATFVDTEGGSGGASNCVVNNEDSVSSTTLPTCTAGSTSTGAANGSIPLTNNGWQKPSWQTGVSGIPSDGVRDLPDVSFFAGVNLQSATLICVSLEGSCVTSAEAGSNPETTEPTAQEIGGTSVASPEMAGVMALVDEKAGAPQGLANPGLYKLAGMQTYSECSAESVKNNSSCYFQDVDSGTITMPCSLGVAGSEGGFINGYDEPQDAYTGLISPNCTALASGDVIGTLVSSGTTPAYNGAAGYDLATGLGSLNVANVVNASSVWFVPGTNTVTMAVTLNPTGTISSSTVLTISVALTGSDGAPTGTIAVAGGGYNASATLNSSGDASVTVPAGTLSPGSVTLTVSYSGSTTYAPTNQTETLNVAAAVPTVTVSAPASQNAANPIAVTVSVSGPSGAPVPTGTVTLAQTGGSYSSTAASLSGGVANINIPANTLTAGTDTLMATFGPAVNTDYTSATGSTTIVISGAALLTPTITLTPTAKTVDSSQSLTISVKVTGSGVTPTGTVTLTSPSVSPAPSATLDSSGSAVLTIPGGSLSSGTPTITAAYSGDDVYGTGSGSTTGVTVTASTYSLSATSPSAVSPGTNATSTITGTNSSTDYSGTVTLTTCTLTTNPSTAVNLPSCSVTGTITYTSGTAAGSGTATVVTTANTAMLNTAPSFNLKGVFGAGGGALLAFLVFLGVPARRKSWKAMLGVLVLLAALGSLSACGGGSSSSGLGTTTNTATSAGTYTFTVTGKGNDPASTSESTTFTLTVN